MNIDRDTVLRTFAAETEEALTQMESTLVQLEREPEDQELVAAAFRAIHTLKGDSQALGFSWLGEVAHSVEELLDGARTRRLPIDPALISILLRSGDALRQITIASLAGNTEPDETHRALLAELISFAARVEHEVATGETGVTHRREEEILADQGRSLRVDVAKLDAMLALLGEVAVSRARARLLLEQVGEQRSAELVASHAEVDRLLLDLQEVVMRARMVPVAPFFEQFARVVRDAALSACKHVRLEVRADGIELDSAVIERIRAPLAHMLRNAVSHGIEPPDVRRQNGKEPCGVVRLQARREAGMIVVEVQDDGAGLETLRIAQRARAMGLAANPERLGNRELAELIFAPGFSTARTVTERSGRGVGLDVVRRAVHSLRGTIETSSTPGEGARFVIRLPLTLAIIQGLLVRVAEESYVVPLGSVVECVDFESLSGAPDAAHGVAGVRGEAVAFVRLRSLFGLGSSTPSRENLVVVQTATRRLGLLVDELLGDAQIVVKPLGRLFDRMPGVSGAAILGSGLVALILDVDGLTRAAA